MRREIVVVGVIILVLGLGLAAFGTRQIPYTTYETVEQQNSSAILDEARTISASDYYAYYRDFDAGEKLRIDFSADRTVSIWLETENEYNKFTAYESHDAVWVKTDITSVDETVTIPNDDVYYVVVFNEYSYSVNYDITVTEYWFTTEKQEVTRYRADYTLNYVGIGIIFIGVIVAIVGATRKEVEKEVPTAVPVTPTLVEPAPELVPKPTPEFCPSCGSEVPPGTEFCPHCGSAV
ncbi:MAG: zinc ribbon domain-containing protein [Promethearchaeota archaeon]